MVFRFFWTNLLSESLETITNNLVKNKYTTMYLQYIYFMILVVC